MKCYTSMRRGRVVALDCNSGRPLWSYAHHVVETSVPMEVRLNRPYDQSTPQRAVVIQGRRLVGLVDASVVNEQMEVAPNAVNDRLVCLDRTDGTPLWHVTPRDLDPTWTDTGFYKIAVAESGRVYVLLRRSLPSGFQDIFLAAVDLTDGALIWRRHLTSASTTLAGLRQVTVSSHARGTLHVADNLGAVAAIEMRNGQVKWLTLIEDRPHANRVTKAQAHAQLSIRQPTAPILLSAGLVVGPLVGLSDCYLFDPTNGRVTQQLDGPTWQDHAYITGGHEVLFLIGPTVRCLDGSTLEPIWEQALGIGPDSTPQGRASITTDRLLIPLRDHVAVLDRHNGTILERHAIDASGHLLALPAQWVVVGTTAIRGYLSWDEAYKRLKQRMDDHPNDVNSGLALAQVALSADKDDVVLEGIDHAIGSSRIQRSTDLGAVVLLNPHDNNNVLHTGPSLFDELLNFVAFERTTKVGLRQKIFERLATAAVTAQDEAAYRLTLAAFLVETGQPAEAVDHYQAILNDPDIARQPFRNESGASQSGFEARWRLKKLIQQYGANIYSKYEMLAAARLHELTHPATGDAQSLLELARIYPLSRAAPKALYEAASVLAGQGNDTQAVALLRRAYGLTSNPKVLAKVVGRLVELCRRQNRPSQAAQWLRRVNRDHPGIEPLQDGQPMTIEQWLSQLGDEFDIASRLPSLSLPLGQPFEIPGLLMTPTHQAPTDYPQNLALINLNGRLQLREGPKLDLRWSYTPIATQIELLAISDEQVLLWDPLLGNLFSLDTADGHVMWSWLALPNSLKPVDGDPNAQPDHPALKRRGVMRPDAWDPAVRINARLLLRHAARRRTEPIFLKLNDLVIVAANGDGAVIALDRYSGELLWRAQCPLERVKHVDMNETTFVLAGQRHDHGVGRQGTVMMLDAYTGQAKQPLHDDSELIRWLSLCGDGLLAYCTSQRVVMLDVAEGAVSWWTGLEDQHFAGQGSSSAELLLLLFWDIHGTLLALDTETGQRMNRIGLPMSRQRSTNLNAQDTVDQWHLLTPSQSVAIDNHGRVLWRDAIDTQGVKNLSLQLLSEDYVVIVDQNADPRQAARHVARRLKLRRMNPRGIVRQNIATTDDQTLYLLDRRGGQIMGQWRLDGTDDLLFNTQRSMLINDAILLGGDGKILVIPGASPAAPSTNMPTRSSVIEKSDPSARRHQAKSQSMSRLEAEATYQHGMGRTGQISF